MNQITLDPKRLVRLFVAFMAVMFLSLSYTQAYAGEPAPSGYFLKEPTEITSKDLTPKEQDLSILSIKSIIGDWKSEAHKFNPIAQAFTVYNAGALIVIAVLFIFTTMLGVLKTAQDGRALGSWSSVMVPFRFVVAMTFLFPTASGFSMAQILLVWIVSNGVGLANMVWDAATEGFLVRGPYETAGLSPSSKDVAGALNSAILSESCMNIYNEKNGNEKTITRKEFQIYSQETNKMVARYWIWGNQKANSIFGKNAQSIVSEGILSKNGGFYVVPVGGTTELAETKGIESISCGAVGISRNEQNTFISYGSALKATYEDGGVGGVLKATLASIADFFGGNVQSQKLGDYVDRFNNVNYAIFEAKSKALAAALAPVQNVKYAEKNPTLAAYESQNTSGTTGMTPQQVEGMYQNHTYEEVLRQAANAYNNSIMSSLEGSNTHLQQFLEFATRETTKNHKAIKDQGWMRAGAFMNILTNAQTDMTGIQTQPHVYIGPTVYESDGSSDILGMTTEDLQRIEMKMDEAKNANSDLQTAYNSSLANNDGSVYSKTVKAIGSLITYDPEKNAHPMVQIQTVGSWLAAAGGIVVSSGYVIKGVTYIASGTARAINWLKGFWGGGKPKDVQPKTETGGVLSSLVSSIAKLFANLVWLAWILVLVGLFLAVVIPLLPVALWLGGIVGWFTAFIVGMVSVPIWNAAHAFPEGSDLAGKGGPGYLLIIELIFRPVLMIFGLIFASVVSIPLMIMMSLLLASAINAIAVGTYNPFVLAGAVIVGIVAYCIGCWIILFRSFHLISVIPQAVFNYIGGQGGQHDEGNTYIAGANFAQRGIANKANAVGRKAAGAILGSVAGKGGGQGVGEGRKAPSGAAPAS